VAIRLALGADAAKVLRLVLSRALAVGAIGIAAGLALTMLLARFLAGQLHGVTAHDPLTTVLAAGLIGTAILLAALRPAIRMARVDPNQVLRSE
jgi:ABC-type antimicrobial peptide transport system permease subunit